ncbi:hypothetical protein D3C85_1911800 [compost metagenome]
MHSPAAINCSTGTLCTAAWPYAYAATALPSSISAQVGLRPHFSSSHAENMNPGMPASEM